MEQVRGQEGWAEWDGLYRPVIAFLAAAREAVPASWLGRDGRPPGRGRSRNGRWSAGDDSSARSARDEPERWRVVHQSFVDFLDRGEDTVDLRAAHDRVASFYLSAWGGLDAGLPALFDPARSRRSRRLRPAAPGRAPRTAGRVDDLHRLLRLERAARGAVSYGPIRAENAWYAARERVGQTEGYMNDLARAARSGDKSPIDRTSSRAGYRTLVGPGIRYALMSTSLNSLARKHPSRP